MYRAPPPEPDGEEAEDEEQARKGRSRGRGDEESESCWSSLLVFEACDSCDGCDLFGTNLILMVPALALATLRGERATRRGRHNREPAWIPGSMQVQPGDRTLSPGARTGLAVLRTYKRVISSRTPNVCHHSVSCSEYAAVQLRERGAIRSLPAIRARLKSCAAVGVQSAIVDADAVRDAGSI